jgi:membrane-associated phospholipid phosphatase
MGSKRKEEERQALNRFADTGRVILAAGATILPFRSDAKPARVSACASLLGLKVLTKFLKKAVPEERPNGEDDKSFPSEHAAECVAAALFIQREYPGTIGSLACALAATVSFTRIQSKKHHPRDVLAGAIMGCAAVWLSLRLRLSLEPRLLPAAQAVLP